MKNGYLDMWAVIVQKPANQDLYLKNKASFIFSLAERALKYSLLKS